LDSEEGSGSHGATGVPERRLGRNPVVGRGAPDIYQPVREAAASVAEALVAAAEASAADAGAAGSDRLRLLEERVAAIEARLAALPGGAGA
jgi:hypothetical protein